MKATTKRGPQPSVRNVTPQITAFHVIHPVDVG